MLGMPSGPAGNEMTFLILCLMKWWWEWSWIGCCNGDECQLFTVMYTRCCWLINQFFMVGKFAGWLMYLPALPNWVSIFQYSMGGSNMTSFTLQEHTFLVAWFSICKKCQSFSMQTVLYPGIHFRSHLLGCLFSKQTPILKDEGVLSMVFWAVLNLFSSRVFFAIASASLCASRFNILESGSPRKHCIGSTSWCKGKFGSHPYTKKNGISAVAKFGATLTGETLIQIFVPVT